MYPRLALNSVPPARDPPKAGITGMEGEDHFLWRQQRQPQMETKLVVCVTIFIFHISWPYLLLFRVYGLKLVRWDFLPISNNEPKKKKCLKTK